MESGFSTYIKYFFSIILIVSLVTSLDSQTDSLKKNLQINKIILDEENSLLNVFISVPAIQGAEFNANTINMYEMVEGVRCPLYFHSYDKQSEVKGVALDTFSILFLLDYSGSMRNENRLVNAKKAIIRTFEEIELSPGSQIYFSAFHENIFDNQPVSKDNIEQVLEPFIVPLPGKGKRTDLYRALIWKTRDMRSFPGKKVLVILSDGENDIKYNPYYINNRKFTQEDVFREFQDMDRDEEFMVFPIGLGKGTDSTFLKELVQLTSDTTDRYIYSENAEELAEVVVSLLSAFSSDYIVKLTPTCTDYKGETRILVLQWQDVGIDTVVFFNYVEGAPYAPRNLTKDYGDLWYWLKLVLIGIVILGLLLMGLMYLVPFFKKREFVKRYVIPYVPEPNKIKRDPITQDAFEEGDMVVVKCTQMTSLSTWQALGHCPNYPSCMEFNDPCSGSGGEDIQGSFFSQQGIFRILNWLWYGAVGGFVGWLFYAFIRFNDAQWLDVFVQKMMFSDALLDKILGFSGGKALIDNVDKFVDQFLYGLFTGTFVIVAITIAEELGQTRKFSIKRLLLRAIIGLFVSFLVFFISNIFHFLFSHDPFLSQLITWLVFGLAFGAILSINSSIDLKRGILGSVIAVTIAFGIYYAIYSLLPSDDGLQKLLSNMALGAVLGGLVVTIIANLEDFELVYLSPSEYTGMVKPISKWLKKGMEIYIGTSSKCYVFIKWDDEFAQDQHAKLIYFGGVVYIIPLFETLVNGVIVPENQKTPLQNNDIIQLGRYSNTKMQYKEKRSPVN